MNFEFLRGACVVIEGGGKRIMVDPWLCDDAYFGSFAHYPPYEGPWDFNLDYIYISHIHPDHYSQETLRRLPKVPVLIHEFKNKFLKRNIEALGFEVRELPNNTITDLGGIHLNVIAADDCNPELCQRFFGCDSILVGDTQIDSLAVFDDGRQIFVNINDCPWLLTREIVPKIRRQYPEIDVLMVAYAGSGPYPQCFEMPNEQKVKAAELKKENFLKYATYYARELKAKKTYPFAGGYVLAGRLAHLTKYRGMPSTKEVNEYFRAQGIPAFELEEPDEEAKAKYVKNVLSKRKFDFDDDPMPTQDELMHLLGNCESRIRQKCVEIGLSTKTTVYLQLLDDWMGEIHLDKRNTLIMFARKIIYPDKYIKMTIDPRLLKRLLMGPKHAHWNNAEIGSHIWYERKPDTFERGIYHAMSFLHGPVS